MRTSRFRSWLMVGVLVAVGCGSVCLPAFAGDSGVSPGLAGLKVRRAVLAGPATRQMLVPEGVFVTVGNEAVADWLGKPFDRDLLREIRTTLAPHLRVELTPRGFAPAATRAAEGEADATNYDAIWVRDNVWVQVALARDPARRADARRLLLALWDYYAMPAQVARFKAVIADPALSLDQMAMPHIRFDGRSPTLDDVKVNGRPEVWNHRQIDAHGLFFTALGEAVGSGMVRAEDCSPVRLEVLSLFPLFLDRIGFDTYEDAGAWEELPRRNTSSIALATRALQVWGSLMVDPSLEEQDVHIAVARFLKAAPAQVRALWEPDPLARLIERGLARVRRQLVLGGESPEYDPTDMRFRRADAALLVLLQPSPLAGLTEAEKRQVMQIVETLERPAGILRYELDSYQGGNYWITPPSTAADEPTLTGDSSSDAAFRARLARLLPDTEAQWFFDSLCVLARLHLAETTADPRLRQQDLHRAAVHLKRALGQITGPTAPAADGEPVRPWQAPESINTVVLGGRSYLLPSPITPLNWAKAGLDLALREFARVALNDF
jgi:hypothetical protein